MVQTAQSEPANRYSIFSNDSLVWRITVMNYKRIQRSDTLNRDAFALFYCQWMVGRFQLDKRSD